MIAAVLAFIAAAVWAPVARAAGSTPSTTVLAIHENPIWSGTVYADLWARGNDASGPSATGTIELHDGGRSYGTFDARMPAGTVGENATLPDVTGGQHTFVANYSGDATYAPSSATLTVTVQKRTVHVEPQATAHEVPEGQAVTFTEFVRDTSRAVTAAPAPTGSMTFFDNGNAKAITPTGNGYASFTTTLPPGQHRITASYGGDAYWAAGTNDGSSSDVNVVASSQPSPATTTRRASTATTKVTTSSPTTATSVTTVPGTSSTTSSTSLVSTTSTSTATHATVALSAPSKKPRSLRGPAIALGAVALVALGLGALSRRRSGLGGL